MANVNNPRSFQVLNEGRTWQVLQVKTEASLASKDGDVLFLNSAGRATATNGVILGIQKGGIVDQSTGEVNATAAEDDLVNVYYEPDVKFTGQSISGALADPYTTRSAAACFDIAGNAGVQYCNSAASSNDTLKVIGFGTEEKDGSPSAVGAYQKQIFMFNPVEHFLGTIA